MPDMKSTSAALITRVGATAPAACAGAAPAEMVRVPAEQAAPEARRTRIVAFVANRIGVMKRLSRVFAGAGDIASARRTRVVRRRSPHSDSTTYAGRREAVAGSR